MKKENVIYSLPDHCKAKKREKQENSFLYSNFVVRKKLKDFSKEKKYYIRTYGCQANELDSENIKGIVEKIGFIQTDNLKEADLIILNTCAIRENVHHKVYGELGALKNLKDQNKDLIISICGCMAQEENVVNTITKTYPQVDLIFGTHNINNFPNLLEEAVFSHKRVIEILPNTNEIVEKLPRKRENEIKATVSISHGCNKFCTYCIVPYTRGKERSRKKEDIIEEIKQLKKQGYKEVMLLGQNVNAYGKDLEEPCDFGSLLEEVAKIKIERIRFMTSHPRDFNENTLNIISKYDNIMPNIHLPIQSGDDEILKKMGRGYDFKTYQNLFNKIKQTKPNMSITTDIIVGFPGESNQQFQNTLNAVKKLSFDSAYTFIYSPRENTPAASFEDNVSEEEKKERLQELIKEVGKNALKKNKQFEGKTVKVLVEGVSKKNEETLSGYCEEFKLVNFKGPKDLIGQIVEVEIIKGKSWTLEGKEKTL